MTWNFGFKILISAAGLNFVRNGESEIIMVHMGLTQGDAIKARSNFRSADEKIFEAIRDDSKDIVDEITA